jgi:two-component system, NtrC family, nitrogen regulation sensor histidine kinase GlnL
MVNAAHYKQILDSLLTAAIVLDTDLKVSFVNTSAEVLLSVSSEQVLNKHVSQCFSDLDGSPESFRAALADNRNFTMRRARWRLHNNSEVTVDYSVTPNPELGLVIIEAQGLDRLLRISREEAMLSTQETSRNLIRSMAHEIKNPLGGIRGAAQLLARELSNQHSGDFEEYTRIIIDETDRLRNLVDRMLGPHRAVRSVPTNVHEILEHVMSVLRAETENCLPLVRDYDPSIPEIPGDRELLIQAILNVARNAVQVLMENGREHDGEITFRSRVQHRFTIGRKQHPLVVKISIIDNGPGIPSEIIEDIFFPMITGRAEGTGLGLAIAQNLIGQHQGIIECDSEPGLTEFSIYLPLEEHYAEA